MSVFTTPFTTPGNYTYNSSKIEVTGGLAKLLDISTLLSGLQAYWRMEEASWNATPGEVIDSSSSGLHGQAINGANTIAAGKLGRCGQFDGSNDQIVIPDNSFSGGDFTIAAWVKTSSTGYRVIFASSIDNAWNYPLWLFRMNTSLQMELVLATSVSNTVNVNSVVTINDSAWHLVIGWREGDVGYIQVDNGTPQSAAFSGSLAPAVENRIGERFGGSTTAWQGELDEIAIWNRVLTSDERTDLNNGGSGKIIQEEYSSDSPTIYKTAGDSDIVSSWGSFIVTEGTVEGSIRYQLSSDGATWYYWNGAWVVAGASDHNIEATINANIGAFPTAPDKIYVKSFFVSDGTQQVEIDEIQVTYTLNQAPLIDAGQNKVCKDNQNIKPFSDASFSDPDGCYSEDTEVLTENGWKLLKKIVEEKEKIRIATLNPVTHLLEYEYPINYFEYDYVGKMLHLKGGSIDCLVTPGHNVYLRRRDSKKWEFIKAKDIKFGSIEYKKDCNWEGKKQEYFFIPSITHIVSNKYSSLEKTVSSKQVKMDDWLRFFGIWLAEGSVYYTEKRRSKANRVLKSGKEASLVKLYVISIAQNNEENRELIKGWVKKAGFNCCENGNEHSKNIVIYNKQLAKYLMPIKGAKNKYVPNEFKKLSKHQLWVLFDSMMLGDGHKGKTWFYSTSSRQLAYDFEEIALKLGFVTNVSMWKDNYRIQLSKNQLTPEIRKMSEWVKYVGKVYCLEVPNHLMYVRRNGKAIWSGNSVDYARYKVDGEQDAWTEILQGAYASLLEAVQDFNYQFNNVGGLTVRLQVEDNIGDTSDDSLTVTVTQYTKTINIRHPITNEHIDGVEFNSGDGSGSVLKNSPFSYSWDYGTFDLILQSAGYYSQGRSVLVDNEADLNLVMNPISYLNECVASVGWVVSSDILVITTWLLRGGSTITAPTSCTINFIDEEGNVLYTDSSNSVGVDGVFKFEKSPSGLPDEGVYRVESSIVFDSITYSTLIPLGLINRRVADFLSDVHDETLGEWILNPDAKTLTLLRIDGTTLKVFDLTDTTRTLPSFIGRTPR